MAIDSTDVATYANPNGKSKVTGEATNPDARWGVKHSAKSSKKDGTEFFFGFKIHMVADVTHDLPLTFTVLPGNENDSPELRNVMDQAFATYEWFKPEVATADRGYDSAENFNHLFAKGIDPIIHIRKPAAKDGLYVDIYDEDLMPQCLGGALMEYVGRNGEGHDVYRCPSGGCHLKGSLKGGTRHCDIVFAEDPTSSPEMMRVLGPITRRGSRAWNKYYAKRWGVERIFKSLKQSRRLEDHCVHGIEAITLHALMSVLTFQATALAKVLAGDKANMRWMTRRVA